MRDARIGESQLQHMAADKPACPHQQKFHDIPHPSPKPLSKRRYHQPPHFGIMLSRICLQACRCLRQFGSPQALPLQLLRPCAFIRTYSQTRTECPEDHDENDAIKKTGLENID
jgi:hypothetical protein